MTARRDPHQPRPSSGTDLSALSAANAYTVLRAASSAVAGVESGLVDHQIEHKTNPESQNHNQQHCIDVHVAPFGL
jgi:hypothetical protein